MLKLQTTRSWDFLGFPVSVKRNPVGESNVIVGMFDTGVWPESESFNDKGLSPLPKKWKGTCQTDGNFTCNNKLIGARYYRDTGRTARDTDGHGSHTASTVAGREVKGASLFGIAEGTARGAVSSARIAAYKVCGDTGCPEYNIFAAFDDAIADGVDIISVSLGRDFAVNYSNDALSIGAFHAMKKGILTVQSAGNAGPAPGTLGSVAPWMFSVAASNIDRKIITKAVTGNGAVFQGRAINIFNSTKMVPLVNGANASSNCQSLDQPQYCNCLDKKLVKGKIVFCEGLGTGDEGLSAGAAGQIMEDVSSVDYSLAYILPATLLNANNSNKIKSYINKTIEPKVRILKSESINDSTAPVVVSFSSRGPNLISEDILKPDISAPAVDIIAAFSPEAPVLPIKRKITTLYNILSGTSMACPHVSGAAAYVKSFHPEWSPAAIKSALMTTAFPLHASKNRDAEFAYGAGQINPVKAVHPGLVYDTHEDEYIQFLCNEGYNATEISLISGENVSSCNTGSRNARDLNYPSMALLVPGNKSFSSNFSRSVTNVGTPESTYVARLNGHRQLQIRVRPEILSFKSVNETKSFVVTISGRILPPVSILSASLLWSDGFHSVRSPIVVYTKNATSP